MWLRIRTSGDRDGRPRRRSATRVTDGASIIPACHCVLSVLWAQPGLPPGDSIYAQKYFVSAYSSWARTLNSLRGVLMKIVCCREPQAVGHLKLLPSLRVVDKKVSRGFSTSKTSKTTQNTSENLINFITWKLKSLFLEASLRDYHCGHWPIKVLNIRRIYWE